VTHSEKKNVIEKIVVVPDKQKRNFWGREIKSLNTLIEKYPEENFWKGLTFTEKFDSIIILRSGYFSEQLLKKYRRYKYTIPKQEIIKLGEKIGDDYKKEIKPKNIREFLS
jgi:hypothetical protein